MKKLLFLLMIIGFYACSEDLTDNVLPNQDKAANKQEIMTRSAMLANESVEPTVKLGNKLENPYSVRNMKAAVRALKATGNIEIEVPESSIHPTHLYIEFSPESKEQLDILKADTTIEFYSYPLDYELIGTGVFDTAGALEDTQVESFMPRGHMEKHCRLMFHILYLKNCISQTKILMTNLLHVPVWFLLILLRLL